jgi:hypothetical protein
MSVQRRNFASSFERETADRLSDSGLFGGGERVEPSAGIKHRSDCPNDRSSDLKLNTRRPYEDSQRRPQTTGV